LQAPAADLQFVINSSYPRRQFQITLGRRKRNPALRDFRQSKLGVRPVSDLAGPRPCAEAKTSRFQSGLMVVDQHRLVAVPWSGRKSWRVRPDQSRLALGSPNLYMRDRNLTPQPRPEVRKVYQQLDILPAPGSRRSLGDILTTGWQRPSWTGTY